MVLEISSQKTLWLQVNRRRGPSRHTHGGNSELLYLPDPAVGIQALPALALRGEPGALAGVDAALLVRASGGA